MPTFKDPKKLAKYLEIALGETQKETIITTQARLGSSDVSPIDTGRFRSSWFAAEGSSSNAAAPEGANSPNTNANGLAVDATKTYHLTNNLPYAQAIAVEGRVVSKSPTWFTSFRNNDIPKIGDMRLPKQSSGDFSYELSSGSEVTLRRSPTTLCTWLASAQIMCSSTTLVKPRQDLMCPMR